MSRSTLPVRPVRPASPEERGSVLIFVVGILLLLAIVATAFLGTSRSDRTATQQNAYNTQIDLLLEGVVNTMKGSVLGDARFNDNADDFDAPVSDTFLASRIPQLSSLIPFSGFNVATARQAMWPYITGPQLDSVFSYPMTPKSLGITRAVYKTRHNVIPAFVTYNGQNLPGFTLNETDENDGYPAANYAFSETVPAMDADGDGVADSGMVRLPIGPLAGVTYYYGARIVDLNSAINFNTAQSWNDNPAAGSLPGNFFPSNIDLSNALAGDATTRDNQLNKTAQTSLNAYRLGQTADPSMPTATNDAADDNQVIRNDYQFTTTGEGLWFQLGRRLGNPGYVVRSAGNVRKAAKLDINNTTGLVRNFVLKDPSGTKTRLETALSLSLIGQTSSVPVVAVKDTAYKANDTVNWFNGTFAFQQGNPATQLMPLRSILTGTNPTGSDTIKPAINETIVSGNNKFGDVVTVQGRRFFCIAPSTATAPDTLNGLGDWTLLSWVTNPQKTDINTADFGELWWTFRRLMSADNIAFAARPASVFAASSPFPIDPAGTTSLLPGDRNKWRQYRNVIRDPLAIDPIVTADARTNLPAVPDARYMTSSEVLQMRAALAAVNTLDIRDNDDNITARRITTAAYPNLPAGLPVARHDITVFGTERQPYLTEVYVNNDISGADPAAVAGPNPRGYVAVEFYNPYPVALNLNHWSLGLINRRRGAANPPAAVAGKTPGRPLQFDAMMPATATPATATWFDNTVTIPAYGFLILESFNDPAVPVLGPAPLADPSDSLYRPTSAPVAIGPTVTLKYIPGLARVLNDGTAGVAGTPNGGELVLLRPRVDNLSTGNYTTTVQQNDPVDPCDEGLLAPNLYDMVPIDSFDFTNMNAPVGNLNFNVWHYVRENDAAGADGFWKCVVAHPYVVTGSPGAPPQTLPRQGEVVATWASGGAEPALAGAAVKLGLADPISLPLDSSAGVQVNSQGWPGPRKKDTTLTFNLFPAGAFSRETDVFKIPTFGAYKILTRTAPIVPTPNPDGMTLPATTADVAAGVAADLPNFTEMNSVAMDHSFADDEDLAAAASPVPGPGGAPASIAGPNDGYEQVGRLCPTHTLDPATFLNYPITVAAPASTTPNVADGEYRTAAATPVDWYDPSFDYGSGLALSTVSRSIFDYFTVMSHNNAVPDVGADEYVTTYMGTSPPNTPPQFPQYVPSASSPVNKVAPPNITYMAAGTASSASSLVRSANVPDASTGVDYTGCAVQALTGGARGLVAKISSGGTTATMGLTPGLTGLNAGDLVRILAPTDDGAVDQGLVNINTAPWYVLARLPLVLTAATGNVDATATSDLAKRIVLYRDGDPAANLAFDRRGHGPFKSILDLNAVVDAAGASAYFQGAVGTVTPSASSADKTAGDITPAFDALNNPVNPESVDGDFENRYLTLSRVANMITTRSDGFVVYVVLQGWRDAGTANAQMVTQRRAALILDRSGATATVPSLITTRVPSN